MGSLQAAIDASNKSCSSSNVNQTELSKDFFDNALKLLDDKIGQSEDLKPLVPLNLIVTGGYVSVTLLQNRNMTEDIDYFIDPSMDEGVGAPLTTAIKAVSREMLVGEDWMNSNVTVWIENRAKIYQESCDQQIRLWQGKNIVLYAAKLEWSLVQKLERQPMRPKDLNDCVSIVKILVDKQKVPLTSKTIIGWSTHDFDPIDDRVIMRVAKTYKEINNGKDGIIMNYKSFNN